MDVTVAVATFGDDSWQDLARKRAIPSADTQAPVVHTHGDTLAGARNEALAQVDTEWVIHLDADDELEPGYVEAMRAGTADMRCPAVRQMIGGLPRRPAVPKVWRHRHDCTAECLLVGNWLVIGTALRADLVRQVGGWEEWGWSEDWALFLRCYLAGATVEAIPAAIYRAYRRKQSRNRLATREKLRWHSEIERAILPPDLWVVER